MFHEWVPKSFVYLKQYRFAIFKKDLFAGLTVGVVALPLAMAFAIASGVSPEKGIFTAIVAGFLVSALGGSAVQIGGPTGAFVVVIYDVLQRTGYEGLAISTLLASLLLILFGLLRLGSWIKYVPYSLIMGFTTGIALLIFSSQIKDFFGLPTGPIPAGFFLQWKIYCEHCTGVHFPSLAVGLSTLIFIVFLRKFFPRLPWGIIALFLATSASLLFSIPVPTIVSKFGHLPHTLPALSWPSMSISFDQVPEVVRDGFTIAFLAAVESLLSATVADGMLGTKHKSNCELVAQGVANFGSILFGGIPATGAIARTATNIKSGGQTPVAGMIHALTLFLILFGFSPLVGLIPLPSLSAILIVVAWNMSEIHHFLKLAFRPSHDTAILLVAFFLTVLVDITVAIMAAMVLASFLFMKRVSLSCKTLPLTFQEPTSEFPEKTDRNAVLKKHVPPGVAIYEMEGPFFFGSADILQNLLGNFSDPPKVFILKMRHVSFIDASGAQSLKDFAKECQKHSITLFLSGVRSQTKKDFETFGLTQIIRSDHFFSDIDTAIREASLAISKGL